MKTWIKSLDRVLRGEATGLAELRRGEFAVPSLGLSSVTILLGIFYGLCMGLPAVITRYGSPTVFMGYEQLMASAVKVPMLFFLTLFVTFPSLYVFNALVGSRLAMGQIFKLLVAAVAVIVAVLASFGPIVAFFAVSTSSHPFMILLNVAVFAVAGLLGMAFLLQTLNRLTLVWGEMLSSASRPDRPPVASENAAQEEAPPPHKAPGALDRLDGMATDARVKSIFRIWAIIFGLVGAQMGWVLRPFIGDASIPFIFFSPRESNFFQAVANALIKLLS
jgi:hypothetical protein